MSRNLYNLPTIGKTLEGYGLHLPREHRRVITLIANKTNLRLAFKCAAAMQRDRDSKIPSGTRMASK